MIRIKAGLAGLKGKNLISEVPLKDALNAFIFALNDSAKAFAAHPTNQGDRFHKPKEKLYICTMNPQGLLALAQLILPSEILSNFEVVRVEEESSLIRIYLGESVRAEYKENSKTESKGVLWVHPKSLGD